jgi:hypothetical protein
MENLIEVPNEFLLLIQVQLMIQNKTGILNLKTLKTQVPIDYLKKKKKKKKKPIPLFEWKMIDLQHHHNNCTTSSHMGWSPVCETHLM